MEEYLDITKSVMISSPAGSGKTEKLARRYISLLENGSEIERILAITFTEKAAAEMKERILSILEKEHHDLFIRILEKMPMMRISTIHAFCLKLLKRFSIDLGLDPSLEVTDEFSASILWTESIYESLMSERETPGLFFSMMTERGIKGWSGLFKVLNLLHGRRPHPEVMLKESHPVSGEERKILDLYSKCLARYTAKKREKHLIDFDDIELLAYEAIAKTPEWQNILYSFDEHTDHILVDEFQDTSSIQWKIIDKITEEWRSGLGAKRDDGKIPTIFLVGDEKQSIYLFRGANVSIFQEAGAQLSEWLGSEYHFEEIRENYRSLPEIVDFTNSLFKRLMSPTMYENWRTRYSSFEATRKGTGKVELVLLEGDESVRKSREHEASVVAKRIVSLNNLLEIWDEDSRRKCSYGDMAILLRKRTHLTVFEDALRRYHIPFIVVKGIGFYDEPEVAMLRELLCVIVDPMDDYSLFCVLRSPLFHIDYRTLSSFLAKGGTPLLEKLCESKNRKLHGACELISGWAARFADTPLAVILEEALREAAGWQHVWEEQRHANVKKFIGIVEQFENQGLSGLAIREKLISARSGEEPKAHISSEGMNTVRIMTIHAAKGLQFPIVFLPSLEEDNTPRTSSVVIDEEGDKLFLAYEEDSSRRQKIQPFRRRKEKELEEEKRLFYVAVTRARDFLCMTGSTQKGKKNTGRLDHITENIDYLDSLHVLSESDVDHLYSSSRFHPGFSSAEPFFSGPVYTDALTYDSELRWRNVTEDLDISLKHGDDWLLIGRIFHSIFEELSKGMINPDEINERASVLLRNEIYGEEKIGRLLNIVRADFGKLAVSGYLDEIILPQDKAFAELPFILEAGNTVFKGRIDRLIVRDGSVLIYDYKTFPVRDSEFPELLDKYRSQMSVYRTAAQKLFSFKVTGYLLFTHKPLLLEV